jgi:uncharacterized membrane protein
MCDAPHSPWLTAALMFSSFALFAFCFESARRLIGITAVWSLAAIALPIGWFAEQMGSSYGWFFGHYCYTSVLGPRLGDVPVVIPLMWFALIWIGLVLANLILWRNPWPGQLSALQRTLTAWLAAMIVTAFDLGADPYFVFQAKAWIMEKKDGGWFGETLQGFVGWMLVGFVIAWLSLWRVHASVARPWAKSLRYAALWPMLMFGGGMVFQMLNAHPIEIRAIAFFAMGIPLVAAAAAWWQWSQSMRAGVSGQTTPAPTSTTSLLQAMTEQADAPADDVVGDIVGLWPAGGELPQAGLQRLMQANQIVATWGNNGSLRQATPAAGDKALTEALASYLRQGSQLPQWLDKAKVERAEALFVEHGPLSCTLLFCASLPECYVAPHLARTLHISGQLETNTEYRIRQTAAMIFPVMMKGGLLSDEGYGLAQILKVRLVHATIRHLILHGNPKTFGQSTEPIQATQHWGPMQAAMLAQGWSRSQGGLPVSQFELAYTLLTFSYVFLRGLRSMGLAWRPEDEQAYLHLWNLVGHVLGVRYELMAHSMEQAQDLFEQMQHLACAQELAPDPRPALGQALTHAMAKAIRIPILRKLPAPMMNWLLGKPSARAIGVACAQPPLVRLTFALGRGLISAIDGIGRIFVTQFSLSRMLTRALGYHLISHFLLDQTRPINLPQALATPMAHLLGNWAQDKHAPAWVNSLEDQMTTPGHWHPAPTGSKTQ